MASFSGIPGFQHGCTTDNINVALSEQQKRYESRRHRNRNKRLKARERKERKRDAAGKHRAEAMTQYRRDIDELDKVIDDNVSGQAHLQGSGHSHSQISNNPWGSVKDLWDSASDLIAIDDATTIPGWDGPVDSPSSDLMHQTSPYFDSQYEEVPPHLSVTTDMNSPKLGMRSSTKTEIGAKEEAADEDMADFCEACKARSALDHVLDTSSNSSQQSVTTILEASSPATSPIKISASPINYSPSIMPSMEVAAPGKIAQDQAANNLEWADVLASNSDTSDRPYDHNIVHTASGIIKDATSKSNLMEDWITIPAMNLDYQDFAIFNNLAVLRDAVHQNNRVLQRAVDTLEKILTASPNSTARLHQMLANAEQAPLQGGFERRWVIAEDKSLDRFEWTTLHNMGVLMNMCTEFGIKLRGPGHFARELYDQMHVGIDTAPVPVHEVSAQREV